MGPGEERWKKLDVWRLADDFAEAVYQTTKRFPKDEQYGVTLQLRKAVVSVPTNIVEGYSRRGDRELARFLEIALGSLGESKYLLHLSRRLAYILDADYGRLSDQAGHLGQKLYRFYDKVKKTRPSER